MQRGNLDDSDFVGDIQSVVVGREFDVSFLSSIGSDEGVDLK